MASCLTSIKENLIIFTAVLAEYLRDTHTFVFQLALTHVIALIALLRAAFQSSLLPKEEAY